MPQVYVFNFFTSFGYFAEEREHTAVVRNMATSLRHGGTLVVDYLNVRHAGARLTSDEVKEIDGVTYRLTRWTDARHCFKRIVVEDGAGTPIEHVERVAKFTLQDFERMFAPHHLSIEQVHGDYHLSPKELTHRRSPGAEACLHERELFLRERCPALEVRAQRGKC